jgi:hypothetical protein
MISQALLHLEHDLRQAAGRRDYVVVQHLVAELGAAAVAEARALPAGDPQIREIAAWLTALYDWTEAMLRITRAAQAEELRRIPFLKTYLRQNSLSIL